MTDNNLALTIISAIGVGLAAFGGVLWQAVRYAGKRLLDEKTGVLTRLVNDNKEFLDKLAMRHQAQLDMCQQHGAGIEKLIKRFDPPERFDVTPANAALIAQLKADVIKIRANGNLDQEERDRVIDLLIKAIERLENHLDKCEACGVHADDSGVKL